MKNRFIKKFSLYWFCLLCLGSFILNFVNRFEILDLKYLNSKKNEQIRIIVDQNIRQQQAIVSIAKCYMQNYNNLKFIDFNGLPSPLDISEKYDKQIFIQIDLGNSDYRKMLINYDYIKDINHDKIGGIIFLFEKFEFDKYKIVSDDFSCKLFFLEKQHIPLEILKSSGIVFLDQNKKVDLFFGIQNINKDLINWILCH